MANRIAVLMTCHNRAQKTLECLKALYGQKIGQDSFSTYLVDDGSTDNTTELVRTDFPEVKLIKGDGTLFWNRGMHLAWANAAKNDYDYYIWLNDDTILFPDAIEDLMNSAVETDGDSIIVGTTQSAFTGEATYGGRLTKVVVIEPNGEIQKCDYFNGNCILVPRHVFKIIGNLDYAFNHSLGDWDYGLRAKKKGIKSYVSKRYIASCEKHAALSKWCSPAIPLNKRISAFKSPLAVNPYEYFTFDSRHNGYLRAFLHFVTIHLRLLFPGIWAYIDKSYSKR